MPNSEFQRDLRYAKAASLLGLASAEIALQHSALIGPDLLYVWATPLGKSVLLETVDRHALFEPGVLLPVALERFNARYSRLR